eukprot:TRINITY_DN40223_c0_g1_i1.p1 TRINITY_DN40223_c0_g1~~TRINITY_DN40223_c0_g1_i1.p1  ORF type:complete len:644 (+),score=220.35 TRINITY_DN40223_c0_g1_i1:83-1933(+)
MGGYTGQCAAYAAVAAVVSAHLLWYYTQHVWKSVGGPTLAAVYLCFLTTIVPVAFIVVDIDGATSRIIAGHEAQPPGWLVVLWVVIFWLTQLMSWAVMPILQCYGPAGEFSWKGRLWSATKENLKLYLALGVVIVVLGVYIVVRNGLSLDELMAMAIAASNAFGLLCIILLLGYGLAQIPRNLWLRSTRAYTLTRLSWQAAELRERLELSQLRYDELCNLLDELDGHTQRGGAEEVLHRLAVIRQVADSAEPPDVEESDEAAPVPPSRQRHRRRRAGGSFFDSDDEMQDVDFTSLGGLVKLHRKAKAVVQELQAERHQWKQLCDEALYLEDAEAQCSMALQGSLRIESVGDMPRQRKRAAMQDRGLCFRGQDLAEYTFQKWLRKPLLRLAGCGAALLSAVLVWCEAVAVPLAMQHLSPANLLIRSADGLHQLSLLVLLPYAAGACYWSLFKLRIFESYRLVPSASFAESLCFTAYMLCRLILPLCYNFLRIAFLTETGTGTNSPGDDVAFLRVYGKMDSVALLGEKFNRFMPGLLAPVCVLVATGGLQRCLAQCGVESFSFRAADTGARTQEGEDLLRVERRAREGAVQRALQRQAAAARGQQRLPVAPGPYEVEV